jgi:hypothetical protein
MYNEAAERIPSREKPYVEFPRPVKLAIDITYVADYGDRDEMVGLQGAPENKEYTWNHKFATASIVGENIYLTAALISI